MSLSVENSWLLRGCQCEQGTAETATPDPVQAYAYGPLPALDGGGNPYPTGTGAQCAHSLLSEEGPAPPEPLRPYSVQAYGPLPALDGDGNPYPSRVSSPSSTESGWTHQGSEPSGKAWLAKIYAEENSEEMAAFEEMVGYAERKLVVRRFRLAPAARCGVVSTPCDWTWNLARALAAKLDIDLLCVFKIVGPFGPVRCRVFSCNGGELDEAYAVAQLHGGAAPNPIRPWASEATFEVPTLEAFERLWQSEMSETAVEWATWSGAPDHAGAGRAGWDGRLVVTARGAAGGDGRG